MPDGAKTANFNLKAVVRETGLKPDTLRAWERRYGLPQPERTKGGHRLYSERDIDILKWLIARQREGLSISRAVALWQHLEAEQRDPLLDPEYALQESHAQHQALPGGETLEAHRKAWIEACTNFDEQGANQVLAQAFAYFPAEMVCTELMLKALVEIGEAWYADEISVQQEHFASELALRRIEALIAASPAPTRPGRIMVACPAQEEHTFSPLLISLLLRRQGWDTLYLGANIPFQHLELALAQVRPRLLVLAAQQLHSAACLYSLANSLKSGIVPLAYGGRIFNHIPALQSLIAGHFLGRDMEEGLQTIEKLLTRRIETPKIQALDPASQHLLDAFRSHRAAIEAHIVAGLSQDGFQTEHLMAANQFMGRDFQAALKLGNLDFLAPNLAWSRQYLLNHDFSPDSLKRYLLAYHQAAKEQLPAEAQSIVAWLRTAVQNSDRLSQVRQPAGDTERGQ